MFDMVTTNPRRHCEEGALCHEAISNIVMEIASGKVQVHPPAAP